MPRIKAVDDAKTLRAEIIPCLHRAHTLSRVMVQLATKQSATLRPHSGSTREEKHHCWTHILQRELSVGRFLGCICTLSKSAATRSNTSVCADARATVPELSAEGKDTTALSSSANYSGHTGQPGEER